MEDARAGEGGGWNHGPFCREKMWARPPGKGIQGGIGSSHGALSKAQSGPSDHQVATQGSDLISWISGGQTDQRAGLWSMRGPRRALPVKGEKSNAKDASAGKCLGRKKGGMNAIFFF